MTVPKPPRFFIIAGHTATGKTSVSQEAAERVGLGHFPISTFARELVLKAGYRDVGAFVKAKGRNAILEMTEPLVAEVRRHVNRSPNGLVVDGVYHAGFLDALRREFPNAELHVVRFGTPRPLKKFLVGKREGITGKAALTYLRARDKAKVGLGLVSMMELPAFSVRNDAQRADAVGKLERFMRERLR